MTKNLPARLDPDAILEAVVEVRFDCSDLPEVVVGRLMDNASWAEYAQTRMPMADIPQPIRDSDESLRFQPTIELRSPDGLRAVKIGGRVMSYHVLTRYPGWSVFQVEIQSAIEFILARLRGVSFSRIGLRYINAFVPQKHKIEHLSDTNLSVMLNGHEITESLNLNYNKKLDNHNVTNRIATADILVGSIFPEASLLVDVDVTTPPEFRSHELMQTMFWINRAHELEKSEFFALLPQSLIDSLRASDSDQESIPQ
jgi:uncharacterized protein (TIGR04255 family)